LANDQTGGEPEKYEGFANGQGTLRLKIRNCRISGFLLKRAIGYSKDPRDPSISGGPQHEFAKISSEGQIIIPVSVRNRLHLNTGDKVVILEENGRFYIENAANVAFQHVEEGFRGAAAEAGFKSEEEIQAYMKEIREERKKNSETLRTD
jgi:antitoxin PrlF